MCRQSLPQPVAHFFGLCVGSRGLGFPCRLYKPELPDRLLHLTGARSLQAADSWKSFSVASSRRG